MYFKVGFSLQTGFEKEFKKRIAFEFGLSGLFYLRVKENQHPAKRSVLVEKEKDFTNQECIDSQPEKVCIGTGTAGVARSIELQNFMPVKVKVSYSFVLFWVAFIISITRQLIQEYSTRKFPKLLRFRPKRFFNSHRVLFG